MSVALPNLDLLLISKDGLAKRSMLSKFPRQSRYGKGVLAWKSGEGVYLVGAVVGQSNDRVIAHLAKGGARSVRFSDVPRRARVSTGKQLFEVGEANRVTFLTPVINRPTFHAKKVTKGKKG
jgi:DNA gyrase/topoisomerase IV subunit A